MQIVLERATVFVEVTGPTEQVPEGLATITFAEGPIKVPVVMPCPIALKFAEELVAALTGKLLNGKTSLELPAGVTADA